MLLKPVCPHCQCTYYYKDIVKSLHCKTVICFHCKKKFKVSKLTAFIICAVFAVTISTGMNLFLIDSIGLNSVKPMLFGTAFVIILSMIIYPYFIKFSIPKESD